MGIIETMPVNIGKRLKEWRTEKKLIQAEMGSRIGVGQSMISEIERAIKDPGLDLLVKISKATGLSTDYWLGLKEKVASPPLSIRVAYSTKFDDPRLPQEREVDYLPVPIVNVKVAAGIPEVVTNEQVVDIAFIHRRSLRKKNPRNLICTFVKGDSMEPALRDGAIVCIDTKVRPEGGKAPVGSIWAVRKDDGVVVKHLQLADGAIVLISANSNFPPEVISNPEAIIGRVVWAWQSFS